LPGFSEAESALGEVVGGALNGGGLAGLVLFVEVFEVGDAPAAAGACAEAFGDQGCDFGVFTGEVGLDFDQGDVEAEADIVGGFHGGCSVWGLMVNCAIVWGTLCAVFE